MARFFIDRPVFAIVIAIVIVILGVVAIPNLPIAAFPEVVPPVIQITASYLGGNSIDLEKTVAQPIEEQLAGLDGMMYFLSSSANNGSITISVTFKLGTNPDTATVQTQNKVNIALPRLPPEVQRQGVVVKKVSSAFLMVIGLISPDDRYDSLFLTNYAQINLLNQVGSLPGVGDSRLSSQEVYSMRVWVDPDKMAKLGLTATDINDAINAQNRQNPAGALGQAPSPTGTAFQYAVTGPGGNTVKAPNQGNGFMRQAKLNFPAGVDYMVTYDSTRFVRASIQDVVFTLLAAVGLVILVVFIFLQNWRATLIPLLTVPVAVIGAIALFPLLGFSINITSMFGLVLSIGIVVDDAIVVVEAVQRNIDEGMSPREATLRAMEQVSAPVVAIACILAAVFIPVAFLGGISGQIYRQFSLSIASSVLLSAFSALSLSPALSSLLLKPHGKSRGPLSYCFAKFNRGFEWATNRYLAGVGMMIRRSALALIGLAVFWVAGAWLFKILPAGFLPDEDQAAYFVPVRLPDGASLDRTDAAVAKIEERLGKVKGVESWFVIGGNDFTTNTAASNVATIVVVTTPWEKRKSKDLQLNAILAATQRSFSDVTKAYTTVIGFPPILGLSNTGGFQFMLEDRRGGELDQLSSVGDTLVDAARKRPEIGNAVNTFRASVPGYSID